MVIVYGVVTLDPTYLGLVVEYCVGGDLRRRLDDGRPIDDALLRQWLSDISKGLKYLYDNRVEHRDLKPGNVLLDHRERAKVTDFGLSKSADLATHTGGATSAGGAAGTTTFMAPELLLDNEFSEKGDVYSFGIVMWEVLICSHLNPLALTLPSSSS